jgi:hypothetical protein
MTITEALCDAQEWSSTVTGYGESSPVAPTGRSARSCQGRGDLKWALPVEEDNRDDVTSPVAGLGGMDEAFIMPPSATAC